MTDTHTVTTAIDDDDALATAAGVRPDSVRVVDASAGELPLEIEGAEL